MLLGKLPNNTPLTEKMPLGWLNEPFEATNHEDGAVPMPVLAPKLTLSGKTDIAITLQKGKPILFCMNVAFFGTPRCLESLSRWAKAMIVPAAVFLSACASGPPSSLDVFSSLGQAAAEHESLMASNSKDSGWSRRHRDTDVIIIPSGPRQTPNSPAPNSSTSAKNSVIHPPVDGLPGFVPAPLPPGADLWARIRGGFFMPELNSALVQEHEKWYSSRTDYFERTSQRGSPYLFHIVEEVQRRGMPTELALLPFIESAFNPQALSSASAAGLWQFMPATGESFDLRRNIFLDDRRNVLASTRAALDYLSKLYKMFGHWHLALAAYNWGEGNVQRAIEKNRNAGLPTDYPNLTMPEETRDYVPKLMAVKNIIASPGSFSLNLPSLHNRPYFSSVPIDRDIDLALAVELAGMDHNEFMHLNPQISKPIIPAAVIPQLLLPHENARLFKINLSAHSGRLATWTTWMVPRKMSLDDIARQVGASDTLLREVNNIPRQMVINGGSTLLIPRGPNNQEDVSLHLADNAVISLTPEAPSSSPRSAKY